MNILFAAVALATAQPAPAALVDHSQHSATQHAQHRQGQQAQHQGEHKCCVEVNGKMECRMMKGDGAQHQGEGGQQGHQGHGSSH